MPGEYVETVTKQGVQRYPLDTAAVCRIGRGDQNAIVLADDLISRHHAMIQQTGAGEFHLIDLGSRNGTFLNGRRVTVPVILSPGDRLTVGRHEFVFHQPTGAATAARLAAMPGASTRVALDLQLVTVLVVDIRDFTGLARRIDEATLAQTIGTFIRKSGTALLEQGTWAQKYIGDAVMAVWLHGGASAPALQELLAVLDGLSKLAEIAGRLQADFSLEAPIRIGAGINSGIASIGNVGSAAFADHTALGDVVNKAFRLESATKDIPTDVALGQATYNSLIRSTPSAGDLFEQHTVRLKGYQEPVPAYALSFASLKPLLKLLRAQAGA